MAFKPVEPIAILIRGNIIKISITLRIIIIIKITLIVGIPMSIFIVNLIVHNIRIPMRYSTTGIFSHILPIVIIAINVDSINGVLCIRIEFYLIVKVYWWIIYIVGVCYGL